MRDDQAAGLVGSQVPGHFGADVVLEAADGRTGQRTKDAVHVPFVVTQAVQYVLDSQPVRFGHTGLVGHGCRRRGCRRWQQASSGRQVLDLHELAAWLKRCGIETVALESTGIYWISL